MSEMSQWKLFWSYVRSERIITIRFFVLVAVILLGITAIILSAVIPAVLLAGS